MGGGGGGGGQKWVWHNNYYIMWHMRERDALSPAPGHVLDAWHGTAVKAKVEVRLYQFCSQCMCLSLVMSIAETKEERKSSRKKLFHCQKVQRP